MVEVIIASGIQAYLLYTSNITIDRPQCWNASELPEYAISILNTSLTSIINKLHPPSSAIIISGGLTTNEAFLAFRLACRLNAKYGFYAEIPTPNYLLIKKTIYYIASLILRPHFCIAIGKRARLFYKKVLSRSCKVYASRYYFGSADRSCDPLVKSLRIANAIFNDNILRVKPVLVTKEIVPTRTISFIFFGRYIHRNNPLKLVSAFSKVLRDYHNARLIMAGYGPLERQLIEMASNLNLSESVSFVTSAADWDSRLQSLVQSHYIICPYQYSGWGLVVREALNAGLRVISSDTVEASFEELDDLLDGEFINSGSEANIYDALRFAVACSPYLLHIQSLKHLAPNWHSSSAAIFFSILRWKLLYEF